MKILSRPNPKQSALTILVTVSQIIAINDWVIAQSIPQISIPNISSPAISVVIPNVIVPGVKVTTTNNIPSTSLKSPPVVPTAITPTFNVTTTNNIPATRLISQPVIPTVNVTTINNIPATSLIAQPVIPTVNVTTTNNIPATSLIAQPVIPTVNVSFNELGLPIYANYDGMDISTNIPSILDLKPLTFSVTGNEADTEPSFLSVINNNGVTQTPTTGVGSTSILIPQPTPVDGQLDTVSTVNVVFPSSQLATGITSTETGNSSLFNLQVDFTPPVLD